MRSELPGGPIAETEVERRLEAFLQEYGPRLRRAIAASCPPHLARHIDDIEQEARIRLWRAVSAETAIRDPASYVHRVAVTVTIDAVRRARARREELSQPADDGLAEPQDGRHPDPEREARAREVVRAVERAAARLRAGRRRAVLLLLQGFAVPEIANLLECTPGRARNLAYRGLVDLRRLLNREEVALDT